MKDNEKNTENPYYEYHKSENRLKLKTISKVASPNIIHSENSLNIKEPALKNELFNNNEQVRLKYILRFYHDFFAFLIIPKKLFM